MNFKSPQIQNSLNFHQPKGHVLDITGLIVVVGLLSWFIVMPKAGERTAVAGQYDQVKTQEETLSKDFENLKKLSASLSSSAADISDLDEALPLQERNIRTQLYFETLGEKSGVVVSNVAVSKASEIDAGDRALIKDPYSASRKLKKVTMDIKVSGTILQLYDFIDKLESAGRITDIESLDITPGQEGKLDLNMAMVTYYFAP